MCGACTCTVRIAWSCGIYDRLCISSYSHTMPCRHRGRAVKANDSKSFDVSRVGSSPAGVVFVWLAWLDMSRPRPCGIGIAVANVFCYSMDRKQLSIEY